MTVGMEREVHDGEGTSVLVVYVAEGGERRHVREVTWVFEDVMEKECWVGAYIAKPTRDADDETVELDVLFQNLEVEATYVDGGD